MGIEADNEEQRGAVPTATDAVSPSGRDAEPTDIAAALEDLRSLLHPEIDQRTRKRWAQDEVASLRKRLVLRWESQVMGTVETATRKIEFERDIPSKQADQ